MQNWQWKFSLKFVKISLTILLALGDAGNLSSGCETQKMVCYWKKIFSEETETLESEDVPEDWCLLWILHTRKMSKTTRMVVNIKVPVKIYTRQESPEESQAPEFSAFVFAFTQTLTACLYGPQMAIHQHCYSQEKSSLVWFPNSMCPHEATAQ